MARMKILSQQEEEAFESAPIFTSIERQKYFDFPAAIDNIAGTLRTPTNEVCFLVMLGYFKATSKFFKRLFRKEDVRFVAEKYGFPFAKVRPSAYNKRAYLHHRKIILEYCGFKEFDVDAREAIAQEIRSMVRSQARPKLILSAILETLGRKKIEIPSYNTLATLIVDAINHHRRELSSNIEKSLSPDSRNVLEQLFEKASEGKEDLKVYRHKLTLLKKFSQSLKPMKINENIEDLLIIRELYQHIEGIASALNLTQEGIKYYANSVIKSEIFQVTRRADENKYLHAVTFITHQYFRLHDALTDALLVSVQNALNSANRDHKEKYYDEREERSRADGSFHLITPSVEGEPSASVSEFFPSAQFVSLPEVLSTVNKSSHFLQAFEHWQVKYTRPRPYEKTFWAGILGYGCNIGTNRMAKISRQINESELEHTINWYFSVENVNDANDRIIKMMDRLELPNVCKKDRNILRTSSDGQKFSVAVDSFHANYSFNYFGKGKGVTVYSFIDERNLMFHSTVISASEREAAYVIDGLMHNNVVKSDIHSTDTHGYSKILSGVMHLLDFSFAPRIKNLKDLQLFSFKKRNVFKEFRRQHNNYTYAYRNGNEGDFP